MKFTLIRLVVLDIAACGYLCLARAYTVIYLYTHFNVSKFYVYDNVIIIVLSSKHSAAKR